MSRKQAVPLIALILTLLTTAPGFCPAGQLTGRQIIAEQQSRHTADQESSRISITLIDRKGTQKHQTWAVYSSKKDGVNRSLIQYLSPANIRGVGLLTWEQPQGMEDDQWLYLSASKTVKRIAGSGKKNQFMGTDLAFEDMRTEDMDAHAYELTGTEDLEGASCWRILSTPSTPGEKKESGYGKRILWVDAATYFIRKAEFYDPHGRHIKTALFEDIRSMEGSLCRSFKATWKRHSRKTATVMVYETIDLNTRLKDTLFTRQFMKRPVR